MLFLGLIKKMVQYVQADVLGNLCAEAIEPNLGTLLVEVVASVLDNEVSLEGKIGLKLVIKRIRCSGIELKTRDKYLRATDKQL